MTAMMRARLLRAVSTASPAARLAGRCPSAAAAPRPACATTTAFQQVSSSRALSTAPPVLPESEAPLEPASSSDAGQVTSSTGLDLSGVSIAATPSSEDPAQISCEDLLATVPETLESRDPHAIFSLYATLFNRFPTALTSPVALAFLRTLGPLDAAACTNVYQDWVARLPHDERAQCGPEFELVTHEFLDFLRLASHSTDFLPAMRTLADVLRGLDRAPFSLWSAFLARLVNQYVIDEYPARQQAASEIALEALAACRERADRIEYYDGAAIRMLELRTHGFARNLPAITAMAAAASPSGDDAPFIVSVDAATEWVAAFARAGDFERARRLFVAAVLADTIPRLEAAHALLRAASAGGNVAACVEFQSALLDVYGQAVADPSLSVDLYSPIIETCRAALVHERFRRAPTQEEYMVRLNVIKVFDDARRKMARLGIPLTLDTHQAILTCLVYANYDDCVRFPVKLAADALEAMLTDGLVPSKYAFHTLMRAYANTPERINSGIRCDIIQQYVQVMTACGVPMSAETYSIVFLSLHPRKPVTQPLKPLVDRLWVIERQMARARVPHSDQSVAALLRVYGAHKAFQHAYRVLKEIPRHGLQRTRAIYFTVMHACKDDEAAADYALQVIYPQMLSEGIAIDDTLLHTLLACCVRVNNPHLAWDLYHYAGDHGLAVTHTLLNYLLKLALYNGNVERAQFVLDEFARRKLFYDATTYYHLMTFFTRIQADQARVAELMDRMQDQAKLHQQFVLLSNSYSADATFLASSPSPSSPSDPTAPTAQPPQPAADGEPPRPVSATADADADADADKVEFRRCPSDIDTPAVPLTTLTLPAQPPLPPSNCAPEHRPERILADSRLNLKALQSFVAEQRWDRAFTTYCSILNDFHVSVLHKFAQARDYRHELGAALKANTIPVWGNGAKQLVLSFPPRIVNYNPYNARAGELFLPKDMATATWLMCTAFLDMPAAALPANFPPLRYVYVQRNDRARNHTRDAPPRDYAEAVSARMSPGQQLLSSVQYRELPVAGYHKLAVARVIFRSSMRVLKSYLGFPTMIRFEWVKDLMKRLHFDVDYAERFRIQIRERKNRLAVELAEQEELLGSPEPVPAEAAAGEALSVTTKAAELEAAEAEIQRESAPAAAAAADSDASSKEADGEEADAETAAADTFMDLPRLSSASAKVAESISQDTEQLKSLAVPDLEKLARGLGVHVGAVDPDPLSATLPYSGAKPAKLADTMLSQLTKRQRASLSPAWAANAEARLAASADPSLAVADDETILPGKGGKGALPRPIRRDELEIEAALMHDDDGMRETDHKTLARGPAAPWPPRTNRPVRRAAEEALETKGPLDL
ncbi:hypothetical protein H9P43_000907 [Blastocladiella emersonii ATCC 22665]|nr:hypothetical protein H9P43_000907 [Blastocladiella emersonii ATCC 22665]